MFPPFKVREKVQPLYHREYPALTNYEDKLIFVVGGAMSCNVLRTVEFYRIRDGAWERAPNLNHPRRNHSCCVQGKFVYALCGFDGARLMNSIERVDAQGLRRKSHGIKWEILNIPQLD